MAQMILFSAAPAGVVIADPATPGLGRAFYAQRCSSGCQKANQRSTGLAPFLSTGRDDRRASLSASNFLVQRHHGCDPLVFGEFATTTSRYGPGALGCVLCGLLGAALEELRSFDCLENLS